LEQNDKKKQTCDSKLKNNEAKPSVKKNTNQVVNKNRKSAILVFLIKKIVANVF